MPSSCVGRYFKTQTSTIGLRTGQPGDFLRPGRSFPLLKTYYSVYICGVLDKREQDSVVGNLRTYHRASHIPKILVQFFEKENWRAWSDPKSGRRGGSRGPETPIAKAWIE